MIEIVVPVVLTIIVLLIALCGRKQQTLLQSVVGTTAQQLLPGLGQALPATSYGAQRKFQNAHTNNNFMFEEEGQCI